MDRPRMFSNCSDCMYRTYSFGSNGCTHSKGGHTIKNNHYEKCIHFRCEWCKRNRCICKLSDFY